MPSNSVSCCEEYVGGHLWKHLAQGLAHRKKTGCQILLDEVVLIPIFKALQRSTCPPPAKGTSQQPAGHGVSHTWGADFRVHSPGERGGTAWPPAWHLLSPGPSGGDPREAARGGEMEGLVGSGVRASGTKISRGARGESSLQREREPG